ncbi:MAG: DUF4124 domain-containing protein [Azoarcus sp.]|jgi:hypothetical protein|nr:DUF4124 domain-containing protein [Azoarcus sp.]
MKYFAGFVLFVFVWSLGAFANAEVYKWKDKDGRLHFSDIPPQQAEGQVLSAPVRARPAAADEVRGVEEAPENVEEAKSAETSSAIPEAAPAKSAADRDLEFRQRRAAAAESRAKAGKETARAERRAQDCQRARTQYNALASGMRVARPSDDGGRVFLDDAGREAEIARAQEMIDAFCDDK